VQVDEYKKAEEIFSSDYLYFSSYSASWLEHAKRYAGAMTERLGLNRSSRVVEIASNDGYLLQYFKERNIPVLGIEPTLGTAKVAREKGIETLTEFFGVALAKSLASQNQKADLLLGNNVLAHVPDLNDFVAGMKIVLKESGIITMEFPHLVRLVAENQFDTIYHEHFSYLSLTTVQTVFNRHGLTLFDVDELPTHGGSLRIYAQHAETGIHPDSGRVADLLEKEKTLGITQTGYYEGFQQRVDHVKQQFTEFLRQAHASGKKVCAYGAAAKGNTLLNYCGIQNDLISFVVDASPHKQGLYLPGSHIHVVAEDELKKFQPDFIVILPWNIKDEIMQQLSYSRQWKSRFVIAIPTLQIL